VFSNLNIFFVKFKAYTRVSAVV